MNTIETCNHNPRDIGIAVPREFPHVALITLQSKHASRVNFRTQQKCVGSLVSDRHVITSQFCISFYSDQIVKVRLGVFNYDEFNSGEKSYNADVVESKYGLSILKLQSKVEFSETIMPACLFPEKITASPFLLTGWTGDWRDCFPKLRKWQINNDLVEINAFWMTVDEAVVINYRQVRQSKAKAE